MRASASSLSSPPVSAGSTSSRRILLATRRRVRARPAWPSAEHSRCASVTAGAEPAQPRPRRDRRGLAPLGVAADVARAGVRARAPRRRGAASPSARCAACRRRPRAALDGRRRVARPRGHRAAPRRRRLREVPVPHARRPRDRGGAHPAARSRRTRARSRSGGAPAQAAALEALPTAKYTRLRQLAGRLRARLRLLRDRAAGRHPQPQDLGDPRPAPPDRRRGRAPGARRRSSWGWASRCSTTRTSSARRASCATRRARRSPPRRSRSRRPACCPAIRRFTAEGHRFRLILSLGAPTVGERRRLMPIEDRWPLRRGDGGVREHAAATRRGASRSPTWSSAASTRRPAHARALGELAARPAREAEPHRRHRRDRPVPAARRPRSSPPSATRSTRSACRSCAATRAAPTSAPPAARCAATRGGGGRCVVPRPTRGGAAER